MMHVSTWLAVLLLFHTWFFYPLLVICISALRRAGRPRVASENPALPAVSVILPVHNGARLLQAKVENILDLDYPADFLEIIIVSDGSTDDTMQVARSLTDPRLKVIEFAENVGKSAAQNRGIAEARFPVLLLTDLAATMSRNSLRAMVLRLLDNRIACVGAEVLFRSRGDSLDGAVGLYWRVEQALKHAESKLGMLLSVAGSAMLVRKDAIDHLDEDTGDDMIVPLILALRGLRTVTAVDATVSDDWPGGSLLSQLRVRRRITLRNLRGVVRRASLLNPLAYPLAAFSLWSHKLLRWFSPVLMLVALVGATFLSMGESVYLWLAAPQWVVYAAGLMGIAAMKFGIRVPVVNSIGAFLVMNLGMMWGLSSAVAQHRITHYRN